MNKKELKNYPDNPGIYIIKNLINNKVFIGQAIKIKKKLIKFLSDYRSTKLCEDIEKYGLDNFEATVLFVSDDKDFTRVKKHLDVLECNYIIEYDSSNPDKGYNDLPIIKEVVENIPEDNKSEYIWIYNIKEKTYTLYISALYASKQLGIDAHKITEYITLNEILDNNYVVERTESLLRNKVKYDI